MAEKIKLLEPAAKGRSADQAQPEVFVTPVKEMEPVCPLRELLHRRPFVRPSPAWPRNVKVLVLTLVELFPGFTKRRVLLETGVK